MKSIDMNIITIVIIHDDKGYIILNIPNKEIIEESIDEENDLTDEGDLV